MANLRTQYKNHSHFAIFQHKQVLDAIPLPRRDSGRDLIDVLYNLVQNREDRKTKISDSILKQRKRTLLNLYYREHVLKDFSYIFCM